MDMNGVSQEGFQTAAGHAAGRAASKNKAEKTEQKEEQRFGKVSGRTIGEAKLSEKASKYYEQLKKKYGRVEFILVSPEMKEEAERNKGTLQSTKDLIVLIDSDKIERMAEDEAYRKKYEGIISAGVVQMNQMKNSLGSGTSAVRSFGMSVDDHGHASYFAVLDRSLAAQRERIAEKRKEATEQKKEAAKRAAEKRIEKRTEKQKEDGGIQDSEEMDTITLTANSWDELLKKIQEQMPVSTAGLMTETEKTVGWQFDSAI